MTDRNVMAMPCVTEPSPEELRARAHAKVESYMSRGADIRSAVRLTACDYGITPARVTECWQQGREDHVSDVLHLLSTSR